MFLSRILVNKKTIDSLWQTNLLGYYFIRGHYLFRATLSESCELRGTDNVQGQISEHIFAPNRGYRFLFSFKSISQHAQFRKLGNILGYSPVLAGEYSSK